MREPLTIKQLNVAQANFAADRTLPEKQFDRSRRRWSIVLLFSVTVSVFPAVVGLVLWFASLTHLISSHGTLSMFGVVLLGLTFAGLILAAHCLDRIDAAEHSIKMVEYSRKLDEIRERKD
jgi:hypothetical protein